MYFPRIVLPLAPIVSGLVDLSVAFTVLIAMMLYYGLWPAVTAPAVVLFLALAVLTAASVSLWLSALNARYRDVKYGMSFGIQLLMYAAPVVYPISYVPEPYRLAYAVNPVVCVVEGFRAALLGTGPVPWDLIAVGSSSAALTFVIGAAYFRRRERVFADVI